MLFSIFYLEPLMPSAHARYREWEINAGHTHRATVSPEPLPPLPVEKPAAASHGRLLLNHHSQPAAALSGGPTQPEMQAFQSVNSNNMVDLFSGDFLSYNIPLLDVGGYPVNIAYHSGLSMDEDASWVGLGWNINPGSITRNMRGLPDDFNGVTDTIKKVASVKPNITWGINVGANIELVGLPLDISPSLGLFHTTYNGWGVETAVNASIDAGEKSMGPFTGSLSITNNSQNGLTINPSVSAKFKVQTAINNGGTRHLGCSSVHRTIQEQALNQYRLG